jgi:hypothetical protein
VSDLRETPTCRADVVPLGGRNAPGEGEADRVQNAVQVSVCSRSRSARVSRCSGLLTSSSTTGGVTEPARMVQGIFIVRPKEVR